MVRIPLGVLIAFGIASFGEGAQEAKDGTYTHKELRIKFAVPKDWTLRTSDFKLGWGEGTLAEWVSADDQIVGIAYHETKGMKADQYADSIEKKTKALKGVTDYKKLRDEKLDRKVGTWIVREYQMAYNDNDFRRVCIFIDDGKDDYNFTTWCHEILWNDCKQAIYKTVDSLRYGDLASTEGKTEKSVNPKAESGESEGTLVYPDAWKGCGKGSWVKYKTVYDMGDTKIEVEMTYALLEHVEDKSYTMRMDAVMSGTKTGQTQKFVIKKPEERDKRLGGGGPRIEEGDETVKVAKGEYKCHWVKTTTTQGWSKAWMCDDVPFHIVKTEGEASSLKSAMQLIDFEKK